MSGTSYSAPPIVTDRSQSYGKRKQQQSIIVSSGSTGLLNGTVATPRGSRIANGWSGIANYVGRFRARANVVHVSSMTCLIWSITVIEPINSTRTNLSHAAPEADGFPPAAYEHLALSARMIALCATVRGYLT